MHIGFLMLLIQKAVKFEYENTTWSMYLYTHIYTPISTKLAAAPEIGKWKMRVRNFDTIYHLAEKHAPAAFK